MLMAHDFISKAVVVRMKKWVALGQEVVSDAKKYTIVHQFA